MTPYTTRAHNKKKKEKGLLPNQEPIDNLANPSPLSPRSPGWYDLATVVVHIGKIDAGHYICYSKRDDQWFKFDDSKVTMATEAQVMGVDAYLLFYVIRSLGAGKEKEKTKEVLGEMNGDIEADGDGEDEG